jgi:nucleotide-binding universal stress UspA family protein
LSLDFTCQTQPRESSPHWHSNCHWLDASVTQRVSRENLMSWLPKKSVVVPFDFSEASVQALESAAGFVGDRRDLHVVHVLPRIVLAEPGVYWDELDDTKRIHHAERAFRDRPAGATLEDVDFQVRIGDPDREIAAFAEQVKAELIVMPSHGRTGLSRVLLGSVAERVVRLAHCPVLILK